MLIARAAPEISSWFIIGNAFGYSTFVVADLFPSATIDVIDAEIEGENNSRGSALTRRIAADAFPNVRLTTGFSPQEISVATRLPTYAAVFIDGLHTNSQMIADFRGVLPILARDALVIFHDVGVCQLDAAWSECKSIGRDAGFKSYEFPFTQSGLTILIRGHAALDVLLAEIAGPLRTENWYFYKIGYPYIPNRPRFFHNNFFEFELKIRQRLKRLLQR